MRFQSLLIVILIIFTIVAGCNSPQSSGDITQTTNAPTITSQSTTHTTQLISNKTTVPAATSKTILVLSASEAEKCNCSVNKYNCNNFSSRIDAQACYDNCKSQGKGDIHRLDSNKDGFACEV
jgi:hypothetical protein